MTACSWLIVDTYDVNNLLRVMPEGIRNIKWFKNGVYASQYAALLGLAVELGLAPTVRILAKKMTEKDINFIIYCVQNDIKEISYDRGLPPEEVIRVDNPDGMAETFYGIRFLKAVGKWTPPEYLTPDELGPLPNGPFPLCQCLRRNNADSAWW